VDASRDGLDQLFAGRCGFIHVTNVRSAGREINAT
jgi:hypothetical protein